jgi:hypothetical protein
MTNLINRAGLPPRLLLLLHQRPNQSTGDHTRSHQPAHHPAGNRTGLLLRLRLRLRLRPATINRCGLGPWTRRRRRPTRSHHRSATDRDEGAPVVGVARVDQGVGRDGAGEGVQVLQRDEGVAAQGHAVEEGVGCGVGGGGAELEDCAADWRGGCRAVGLGC